VVKLTKRLLNSFKVEATVQRGSRQDFIASLIHQETRVQCTLRWSRWFLWGEGQDRMAGWLANHSRSRITSERRVL